MENELYLELEDNEWPRTGIDHDRQIVRAILFDGEGMLHFIRARRDDGFGCSVLIETSGGGVEKEDESLTAAIKRELHEELGAEVQVLGKIGVVSDYYNLIHRHNVNHYFLCRLISIGESDLTEDEKNLYHLVPLTLSYEDAVREYERCASTALGRLIAARELPILKRAKEMMASL
ncbi:MAG: NUDIX hydrolase [Clostridia bacterium]|nr:NUDIX hydrolase [Clostridia bacterium]